ncbi:Cinnamyl-alcohol dehydrogenase Flavonol reductase/cinnamoyl-CoA reductase [Orobanche gracilis]
MTSPSFSEIVDDVEDTKEIVDDVEDNKVVIERSGDDNDEEDKDNGGTEDEIESDSDSDHSSGCDSHNPRVISTKWLLEVYRRKTGNPNLRRRELPKVIEERNEYISKLAEAQPPFEFQSEPIQDTHAYLCSKFSKFDECNHIFQHTCIVGGLDTGIIDVDDLNKAFSPFGNILDSGIIKHPITKRFTGFGFVTFDCQQSVTDAVDALNCLDLCGCGEISVRQTVIIPNETHVGSFPTDYRDIDSPESDEDW